LGAVTDKVSIDLSGPSQTMLTTLYCKALDADWDRPILGDGFAKQAVARIDYDWDELKVTDRWTPLVTVRTAQFDVWAAEFLAANPDATVIHLGCGLDSRVFRLDPGPGVQWYDVDYPAVISLREKVFPSRPNYHLVATPATDPSWLDQIPADRPTLLLAEGISMYLTEDDGIALLQHVVDRFGSGEIQIDYYSRLVVRSQKTHRLQRQSGSTLYWAVNRPSDVIDRLSGVRLVSGVTFFDASTFGRASAVFRVMRQLVRPIPPLRRTFQYHRYAYGPVS
jgi:O-methyltransferase involved in polyketide biosynthesis